ncbi:MULTISPECIES: heavy metal-responsive transcriptional regulator [unclassified Microcoleus]|uniref:heavy metal-responsive transcriptional regulator n=1 Tax=unclassified Microcoleus TaxID=2642155 RepID=UPI002FCEBAF3
MFKISEVSRSLGINPQTLYFYERIGLIPSPQRTEAGYRLFSQLDVDRLAFISRAKSLGLSLNDIKEIISLKEGKLLTCKAVYERLSKKVKEIEENIDQLRSLHDELVPLVEQCKTKFDHPDPAYQCLVLDTEQ